MGIELDGRTIPGVAAAWKIDTKTSSWIVTPAAIRKKLGGAIFAIVATTRYLCNTNGAESTMPPGVPGLLKV